MEKKITLIKYTRHICYAVITICQHHHDCAYASRNKFRMRRTTISCEFAMQRVATSSDDREINPFVGHPGDSTCTGCATIRPLTKCLERVILRRHNDASSRQGSSRIISLECVTVANNSLLSPAPAPSPFSSSRHRTTHR